MKKIGQGYQYKVYDIGNNRVKKVPLTKKEIIDNILRKHSKLNDGVGETIDTVLQDRENAVAKIKDMKIDFSIIGNPKFNRDGSFLQDYAEPVKDRLNKLEGNFEKSKKVVDDFAYLTQRCLGNGFVDKTFNFIVNNGYVSDDEMILVDFGELFTEKTQMENAIDEKKWLTNWSYNKFLNPELKSYYKEVLGENLTINNLDKYWKKELDELAPRV